jgi:ABC-type sugar transport system ATPase subunit
MIELRGVSKSFPGVKALDKVDFATRKGEIQALVGENGAGKSTLIKIIAGVYKPDTGTIHYDGRDVVWHSPHATRDAGINVIYQEFNLFPELSVAENIFMGQEPRGSLGLIDQRKIQQEAAAVLRKLDVSIPPDRKVKYLSVADQQIVEIAKALAGQTKLLILDEPTAVISGHEAEVLFERLLTLKQAGVAIIYISHRLEEIFQIADRATVLKDGRLVDTVEVAQVSQKRLVSMMVGRDLEDIYPPKQPQQGRELLRLDNVVIGNRVKGASLSLHEGEVLGLAGLIGSGRTELAHGIFGSLPLTSGSISLDGRTYTATTPRESVEFGVGFLTEDRHREGLVLGMNIQANMTGPTLAEFVKNGLIDFKSEAEVARSEIKKYAIAARSPEVKVMNLSGGNQQKVLFSRWVRACKGVLILDEPTRGVDVGAKVEIYHLIRDLANRGVAILTISSELNEIIGMCDRVVVMRSGVISGELAGADINEEEIMHLAA